LISTRAAMRFTMMRGGGMMQKHHEMPGADQPNQ